MSVGESGADYRLKLITRETACEGSILEFRRDTVELPDGRREVWDEVHHKKGGGACVVPLLPDGRILLVRQYRPVIGRETLELPAGCREAGEDSASAAARELREETGYAAGRLIFLASLNTAAAYCDETTDLFLAEDLTDTGEREMDEAEEILSAAAGLEELTEEILAGHIRDAKTVAGILACAAFLGRRPGAGSTGEKQT